MKQARFSRTNQAADSHTMAVPQKWVYSLTASFRFFAGQTRFMILAGLFIPVVLLLVLSACEQNTTPTAPVNAPIKVKTTLVRVSGTKQTLSYSGTVMPFQTIPITFATPGTVQTVRVDEGMAVQKGQILATLDQTDLLNLYHLSETQYDQALDAHNRLKSVYDKGSLVEIKWVEIESTLKQAEAARNIAKNNLAKATLVAPDHGIIGKRSIEPGMSSVGLEAPFELVKIDRVYVRLSVPENEIARIKQGSLAKFNVPAIGDTPFMGIVTIVGVVADRFSRTYEVKVLTENPDHLIKPGMVCDIALECDKTAMVLVDYRAVTEDVEGPFVYKVSPSKTTVLKQRVKTGGTTSEGIEIIGGLLPGDEVVCVGINKISDNSKIEL